MHIRRMRAQIDVKARAQLRTYIELQVWTASRALLVWYSVRERPKLKEAGRRGRSLEALSPLSHIRGLKDNSTLCRGVTVSIWQGIMSE